MAEEMLDLRRVRKPEGYRRLDDHVRAVLDGMSDEIAAMATVSALVHHAFGHLWTGFYRVVEPTLLRVGPYQGSLGCLEIQVGRGVCGIAAAERRSIIVPDVNRFPGHITCDVRSRSEIVIPVSSAAGALIAVLDIDSEQPDHFDEDDRLGLERVVAWFADAGR
jgi:GAF domain-containing protein